MRVAVAFLLALAAVVVACPSFDPGDPYRCDVDGDCPPRRTCGTRGVCESAGNQADSGTADAGGPDAGSPDAGPLDAGEVDAGDPFAGGQAELAVLVTREPSARRYFVTHTRAENVVDLAPGGLQSGAASKVQVPSGDALLQVWGGASAGSQELARLHVSLRQGSGNAVVFLGASSSGGVDKLFLAPWRLDGEGDPVVTFVNAGLDSVAVDVSIDGAPRVTGLARGATGAAIPFVLDSDTLIGFADVTCVLSGPVDGPGFVVVFGGSLKAARQAPTAPVVSVLDAGGALVDCPVFPFVQPQNEIGATTRLALAIDGTVLSGPATSLGGLGTRHAVAPVSHLVETRDGVSGQNVLASRTLVVSDDVLAIAWGRSGGNNGFVPFMDSAPRPFAGDSVIDVVNATSGGVLPALSIRRTGGGSVYSDSDFPPGDATTTGAGLRLAPGTIAVSVTATALPIADSTFTVTTLADERLLLVLVDGTTKPKLRVIRNLGPSQTVSVQSPD